MSDETGTVTLTEDEHADLCNDAAAYHSCRRGMRELRIMFAQHGIEQNMPWPEWFAAVSALAAKASSPTS